MSLSLVNIKDKKITVNVGFFIFYFQSLDGYSLEKYIFFLRYYILKGKAVVRVILLSLCSRNALKFCGGVVNKQLTLGPSGAYVLFLCKLTRTTTNHVMIAQIMDQVDKTHKTPCWINAKVCSLFFMNK